MPWDPEQYHRFQAERFAPFNDLLPLVHRHPSMKVIDLGCGTGELTRRLADALPPDCDVIGIDSSPDMLARAQLQARPGLHFAQRDLRELEGGWDLIFSHAVIQWVEDHQHLISSLMGKLNPGGQLVIQMPSNHSHASHTIIVRVASEEPFQTALGGWQRPNNVLPVDQYADLLYANGGRDLTIFEKVYQHVMPGADAMVEWMRGTALIPYMERLPEELHEPFLRRYRDLMRTKFPSNSIFYGFRRILFATTKLTEE